MKILHTADVHFDSNNQEAALKSLNVFYETGIEEKIDLYVIAGDLFNRAVQNTEKSGLPELQRLIQQMLDVAPIVVVEGTPTHDIPGCYEIFLKLKAKYTFTILKPGEEYWLEKGFGVIEGPVSQPADLLILGCPEPSKEWFLAETQGISSEKANQEITDKIRQLLLGLGAIRKSYPKTPCLFVYHGSVKGASICNGQILSGNGIEIGRDDLSLIGADYYALGHIHLAQQIGDLPAYYPGSAYPVNWGELDQKGFNLVSLEPGVDAIVERVYYPYPPRMKITTDFSTTDDLLDKYDLKGYQIWVEVKIKKEDAVTFNPKVLEEQIIKEGAREGSRVTVNIIPTETVRAEKIRDARTLRDKVKIYANNSGEKISESILRKADQLEDDAKNEGLTSSGLHIRIKKLILRGAIGIWKGQRKDEVEIDLDRYDPGLIALIGPNGAGKTTLIENMHPYPEMLTRSGKLQDHFRLKDSFRDLYFIDDKTGIEYRALALIDGANPSGKAEYYLYRKNNNETFEPLTNGRKEDYERKINQLFGSISIFLKSAFISQKPPKNNPDLTDATPGEKKALFRELGGLDYLQTYSDLAKEKEKQLENDIIRLNGKIESLEIIAANLPEKEKQKKELEKELNWKEMELKEIEKEGKRISELFEKVSTDLEENRKIINRIAEIESQIKDVEKKKNSLIEKINAYQISIEKKSEAEKLVKEHEKLKKEEEKLNAERTEILKKNNRILSEYQDKKNIIAAHEKEITSRKFEMSQKIADFQAKKAGFLAKIDNLQIKLEKPLERHCPTCGQLLPENKLKELQLIRAKDENELKIIQETVFELDQDIIEFEKKLESLNEKLKSLVYPDKPEIQIFDEDKLNDVKRRLSSIDIENHRMILDKAKEALIRIEELKEQIRLLDLQGNNLIKQKSEIEKQLNPHAKIRYQEVKQQLEDTRNQYLEINKNIAALKAQLTELNKQIEEMYKQTEVLQKSRQELKREQHELKEWSYLKKACGKDGIQALELDAMGPNITEVANRLLNAAYGSRFQIEIRTTRITGKGSKTKQKEDFLIIVHDSETGTEQTLDTLSGGEAVWVKRAIYDAFGIIRDRNTGTKFLTVFQDEADGALDPEARIHYFRMLQAAHNESGRYHTIIITHSIEAQQMIAQKIDIGMLSELTNNKKETAA